MANFYDDNDDLKFYVEKGIDWDPLVRLTEMDYRMRDGFKNIDEAMDFYRNVMDLVGDFSANEVAPKTAQIDREHPHLENGIVSFPPVLREIFDKLKSLELYGMCQPRDLGGMNCPFTLFMLTNELFARSDVSVTAHYGFHGGMAMAMLLFSTMEGTTEFDLDSLSIKKTRFGEIISEIILGEAWGSMDITEPSAGSDMAALRTRGEVDADGQWTVTGQKIFITSGHAKYHFVIARTEKAESDDAFAGLKGLSMFLVKAFEDKDGERIHYASFDKLEEKLGHHGSATVAINFDKSPAMLIGQRGDGFRLMLQIMNNARVGVGFESLGICESAYRMAKAYAQERPSMGKMIVHHEMIADYLDEMRTDIQAIRALAVNGAYHEETTQKLNLMLRFMPPENPEEKKRMEIQSKKHQNKARQLTPLLKYYASEKAVEMARRCIQIHGGFGYSSEYGAEKLLRDAMVLPIYEGTSQIQSLMAMKDNLMAILKDPRGFLERSAKAQWLKRTSRNPLERRVAGLQSMSYGILQFLMTRLAGRKASEIFKQGVGNWKEFFKEWDPKKDFALAMLHAERLTRILTDVAVAEILFEQSQKFPERTEILERWLERVEPRCRFCRDEITSTGKRLLDKLSAETAE